jgi:diguanylate cyclase (GGDEF)-like protein/PAS domain S-box-containing protein
VFCRPRRPIVVVADPQVGKLSDRNGDDNRSPREDPAYGILCHDIAGRSTAHGEMSTTSDGEMSTAPRGSEFLPVGVLVYEENVGITAVNREWVELSGLTEQESLGRGWTLALETDQRARAAAQLRGAAHGARLAAEWRLATPSTSARWLTVRARPDREGVSRGVCVAAVMEISAEKARESELAHQATHDAVTRLYNRHVLLPRMAHALERLSRHPQAIAVLFMDLDGFKLVNDLYGHDVGDGVLIALGERLPALVRPGDTVARLGGDEFAVLCEDLAAPHEAVAVAERIIKAVAAPVRVGDHELTVGASIGIAYSGTPEDDAEGLLRRADQAMYRAKRLGRGRCEVYQPSAAPTAVARNGSLSVGAGADLAELTMLLQRASATAGHLSRTLRSGEQAMRLGEVSHGIHRALIALHEDSTPD